MIQLGNTGIGKLYLGSTEIAKAYLGSDLVFDNSGGTAPTLPYDAQVEYLQSSGSQYINTGVVIGATFKAEIKAQFISQTSSLQTLLGSQDTNYGIIVGLQSNSSGKLYVQIGASGYALSSAEKTSLHVFTAQLTSTTQSLDVDGTTVSNTFNSPSSALSLYLFARNKETVSNMANAKVYYCKIWNKGTLVRNFIPVRVEQVGYMYDQVSGTLFGNIGSGSFTLGNDVTT